MTHRLSKLVPALVGGVVMAALSSLPRVSLANVACCSWAIVGGGVAAYMLVKRSPRRVKSGDGALVGVLSGLVGSLAILLINIPFASRGVEGFVTGMRQAAEQQKDPQAQHTLNQVVAFMQDNGWLAALLLWLVFTLIASGMATLGGVIGVAIFEKRKGSDEAPGPQPLP